MRENRSGFVKFIVSVVVFVLLVVVSLGGYFAVQYVRGKNSPSSFGPELYYALDLAEENTENAEESEPDPSDDPENKDE